MRPSISTLFVSLCAAALLAGCSPKYNWRDYTSTDAPYRVMFPDKPDTHTRSINLDGLPVKMTMTAAQVDGTVFAVGSGEAPDADKAEAAVTAMKTALVRNLGATVNSEKAGKASAIAGASSARSKAIDVVATGVQKGMPMRLVGHFESRNQRFYQVIVMGPQKKISDEQVEMFLSSFKLL